MRNGAAGGAWVFGGFNELGDQPRCELRPPCATAGCKVEPQAARDEIGRLRQS